MRERDTARWRRPLHCTGALGLDSQFRARATAACLWWIRARGCERPRPETRSSFRAQPEPGARRSSSRAAPIPGAPSPAAPQPAARGAPLAPRALGAVRPADRPRGSSVDRRSWRHGVPGGSAQSVPRGRPPSSPPELFRLSRTGWIPPPFLFGHLADHQRAALELLADQVQLRLTLFLSPLTRRLHNASPGWAGPESARRT